jgi:hypothetical protein
MMHQNSRASHGGRNRLVQRFRPPAAIVPLAPSGKNDNPDYCILTARGGTLPVQRRALTVDSSNSGCGCEDRVTCYDSGCSGMSTTRSAPAFSFSHLVITSSIIRIRSARGGIASTLT